MFFELTPTQQKLVDTVLNGNGPLQDPVVKIYIVGGAVRDTLLGKKPKDIDFATNIFPEVLAQCLRDEGFKLIPDKTALEHGTVKIVDQDTQKPIDITTLREDVWTDGRHAKVEWTSDIRKDAARRDLTINSMFAEYVGKGDCPWVIYDPFDGRRAIERKVIEFVGDARQRIQEDYVRMVRACRFTALGEDWQIPETTKEVIREYAPQINTISRERIRDEVCKALSYDKPSNFFRNLHACGLLTHIFPDLARGVGVEQNEHHAEPVFDHLLRCLDYSVSLTDDHLLRLAALTHDIAKPHTKSVGADGRVHFYKHEVEGASIMYKWMRDMRFSKKDTQYVVKLVRHHQWRFHKDTKDKTIRRWLADVGPMWRDLITLRMADRKGNLKKADLPAITREMRELIARAEGIIDSGAPIFQEDLAINGHDLNELPLKSKKMYREIFADLMGIVHNNPSKNNREWLLNHVKKVYLNDRKQA